MFKKLFIVLIVLSICVVANASYEPTYFLPKVYAVGNIDGKTTGATTVYTTSNPGSTRFYPIMIVVSLTGASGVTVPCTLSVGTNSSTYNNLLTATALTGVTTGSATQEFILNSAVLSSIGDAVDIKVNVTVGATATTYLIKVMVIGYYN